MNSEKMKEKKNNNNNFKAPPIYRDEHLGFFVRKNYSG